MSGAFGMGNLQDYLQHGLLPTPTRNEYKQMSLPKSQGERDSLPGLMLRLGLDGRLNHQYVAEMMGFPHDWTDYPEKKGLTPVFDFEGFPTQSPVVEHQENKSHCAKSVGAYGNAIVPQVALQFFKAINNIEGWNNTQDNQPNTRLGHE